MRQTLHIFIKDVRHSWPYVAIVAAILAALVILDPKTTSADDATSYAVGLLHVALVLAWWLAIAQVVHAETPVGDRQFWVTRPYSWKSLLAAKVLFVLLILLPLFAISDYLILSAFGFQPMALIAGLVEHVTRMALLLMLPGIIAAAVTKGMRQFVSVIALIVVAYGVLIAVASNTHFLVRIPVVDEMLWSQRAPQTRWLLEGLGWMLLLLFLGATVWQYAQRRTMPVRLIVLVTFGVWMVCSTVKPSGRALALEQAPRTVNESFPEVVPVFEPGRRITYEPFPLDKTVTISLPIRFAVRSPDFLDWSLASIAIFPEHGEPWHDGWMTSAYSRNREGNRFVNFRMKSTDFHKLSSGPVRVRGVFAVAIYGIGSVTRIPFDDSWHPVPNFGMVRYWRTTPIVEFRMSFHPPLARWEYSASFGQHADSGEGAGWGESESFLSPVINTAGFFDTSWRYHDPSIRPTELAFTMERRLAVVRRDLEIPQINLSDYVAPN